MKFASSSPRCDGGDNRTTEHPAEDGEMVRDAQVTCLTAGRSTDLRALLVTTCLSHRLMDRKQPLCRLKGGSPEARFRSFFPRRARLGASPVAPAGSSGAPNRRGPRLQWRGPSSGGRRLRRQASPPLDVHCWRTYRGSRVAGSCRCDAVAASIGSAGTQLDSGAAPTAVASCRELNRDAGR